MDSETIFRFAILASISLITVNWFIGIVWFGMAAIDVSLRVRMEEGMLESEFWDQFGTKDLLKRLDNSA